MCRSLAGAYSAEVAGVQGEFLIKHTSSRRIMKKFFVLGIGLGAAFAMTSCKSSESAYKKAYEKAKQQQVIATEQEPVQPTTQVEVAPVTTPTTTPDVNTVQVQTENVTVVAGNGLKAYSVVCGSFSLKANAENLQKRLANAGYNSQIAFNSAKNMYRVVASTFDDKASAVQSRNTLRASYPDAWLLSSK